MDFYVILMLLAEAIFALWLLYRADLLKKPIYIVIAVFLTIVAFYARYDVLDKKTQDYIFYLSNWVEHFRQHGGFAALSSRFGTCNYNIPYLYFLALFSYSSIDDLYLIKLLSIFFDILLAWSAMLIVSRFTVSIPKRMGVFFTVLMLPTVFLNGAFWGQCDSIYVSLVLLGIYCALDDRPILSMALAALSFGFKLQAVFILPVYVVLWMYGKFSWKHFFIFPLTYILLVLPAVLIGRPFIETLTLYLDQSGTVGSSLNYNSPSVFSFIQYSVPDWYSVYISPYGIAAAFTYMFIGFAICFAFRKRLNDRAVLGAAVLLVVGIPFLLPHMHERYFFASDILTLILAFVAPQYTAAALLAEFASLLGYYAFLHGRFLLLMDRGATALILVIIMALVFFFTSLFDTRKKFLEKSKNSC